MDASRRNDLYPEIAPYHHGHMVVDPPHRVYWEQSGNPTGQPVLFCHGGPGAGSSPSQRRFFDPRHYRIILFDQRGAGRSRPMAELTANTTEHLIADMEQLRNKLGITRWILFGGSWGSSLALAYAIRHPDRVSGLILRGIFLCRPSELDWFVYGMGTVFPEAWQAFSEFLPADEREDVLESYYRRLTHPDPAMHVPAARSWSRYETACSTLLPPRDPTPGDEASALALARLEAHYIRNRMFLPDNHFLANVAVLRQIPAVIVQGRYDIVCPAVSAWELSQAWPEAEFVIVPDAGHSAMEPGTRSALVDATEKFKATGIGG